MSSIYLEIGNVSFVDNRSYGAGRAKGNREDAADVTRTKTQNLSKQIKTNGQIKILRQQG